MKAGVLAVSIAFVVILVAVTPSTAELVQVDPAWPSIGPGSDGPSAQPQSVEMQIEGGSAPLLLAPFAAEATGPSTPVAFGFAGVDGTAKDGSLHKPANTHIAVGTGTGGAGRVVMVTSSGLQIWDKMGNPLAGPTPLDTFLGTPAPSAFDPKVLFDQHSGRFFIVILRGKTPNPTGLSNLHIAVSTTRAPSNLTTDWTNLAGSALTSLGGIETWFDDPSIGADRDSLVVTGNLFDSSGTYQGVKIRVFTKASLLAGSYTFLDLDMPDPDRSMFTVQPAHVYGEATDSGNFYLINRVGTTRYRLWEISGAPGAPTIVGNAPQPWSAGNTVSGGAPQSGTAITLPTLSPRVMNAVYRSGHVWLALSSDTDADGKTEVFWAKIATNGGLPAAPTVADSGSIDGSDGDEWVFNPSISVNVSGDAVICYSQSFSDQFPDMRYVSRASTDPPGTFGASVLAMTSPGFYDAFSTANPWGEYSATVVDPDDDLTFWIANEVVKTSGVDTSIWGTFIAKLGDTGVTTSSTTSSSTTTTRSTTSSSTTASTSPSSSTSSSTSSTTSTSAPRSTTSSSTSSSTSSTTSTSRPPTTTTSSTSSSTRTTSSTTSTSSSSTSTSTTPSPPLCSLAGAPACNGTCPIGTCTPVAGLVCACLPSAPIQPANALPICSAARPNPAELWPPNGAFLAVSIIGLTDPDGNPLTTTITGITQDEPQVGTCEAAATGVNTATAMLRADRDGAGDGRVYHVSFTASDGKGGQCGGTVNVCVPHDQRPGHVCGDQGPLVDSTAPCG